MKISRLFARKVSFLGVSLLRKIMYGDDVTKQIFSISENITNLGPVMTLKESMDLMGDRVKAKIKTLNSATCIYFLTIFQVP